MCLSDDLRVSLTQEMWENYVMDPKPLVIPVLVHYELIQASDLLPCLEKDYQ